MMMAMIVDDDQDKRRISSWQLINNVVGALVSTGHQRQFGAKLIRMATIACHSGQYPCDRVYGRKTTNKCISPGF